MPPTRKLSTIVEKEKKVIHMAPGRLSLRPKTTRTVQLANGQFATIDVEPLFYETGGEQRMAMTGRTLDPTVAKDQEILDAVEALLAEKPWMATDVRYQISIHGEFEAMEPWRGYDGQSPEAIRETYHALPLEARPDLAKMMKYELERVEFDEDLDEDVSITDPEKVKVINELHRLAEKAEKDLAEGTVDLA